MRAVVVASLVLSLSACSKRAPECEAIVGIVNPAVDKLTRAGAVKAEKAEDHIKAMAEVSGIAEGAAADLARLQLTVPELQRASAAYQAMAREAAAAARDVGQAVKSAEEGVTLAEKGAKDLEEAAEGLAKVCADTHDAEGVKTCRGFGEAMARFPEDASKTDEANKIIAELDALSFNSKPLLGSGKSVIALMKSNQRVIADLKATEAKATSAEKRFEEAASKETPIVDGLNAFCAR